MTCAFASLTGYVISVCNPIYIFLYMILTYNPHIYINLYIYIYLTHLYCLIRVYVHHGVLVCQSVYKILLLQYFCLYGLRLHLRCTYSTCFAIWHLARPCFDDPHTEHLCIILQVARILQTPCLPLSQVHARGGL